MDQTPIPQCWLHPNLDVFCPNRLPNKSVNWNQKSQIAQILNFWSPIFIFSRGGSYSKTASSKIAFAWHFYSHFLGRVLVQFSAFGSQLFLFVALGLVSTTLQIIRVFVSNVCFNDWLIFLDYFVWATAVQSLPTSLLLGVYFLRSHQIYFFHSGSFRWNNFRADKWLRNLFVSKRVQRYCFIHSFSGYASTLLLFEQNWFLRNWTFVTYCYLENHGKVFDRNRDSFLLSFKKSLCVSGTTKK